MGGGREKRNQLNQLKLSTAGITSRRKGKQFESNPAKQGNGAEVYFQNFPRFMEGETYVQKPIPPKKPEKTAGKGFSSNGNVKREESQLTQRCEAARQRMEKDDHFAREARRKRVPHHLPPMDEIPTMSTPAPLFDLVYETKDQGEEWARNMQKLRTDTKNPTWMMSGLQRNNGPHKTTNTSYGSFGYNHGKLNQLQMALCQ